MAILASDSFSEGFGIAISGGLWRQGGYDEIQWDGTYESLVFFREMEVVVVMIVCEFLFL
jgi:hypothetical protein